MLAVEEGRDRKVGKVKQSRERERERDGVEMKFQNMFHFG